MVSGAHVSTLPLTIHSQTSAQPAPASAFQSPSLHTALLHKGLPSEASVQDWAAYGPPTGRTEVCNSVLQTAAIET